MLGTVVWPRFLRNQVNALLKILLALLALAFVPGAHAGLAGWLTSSACSWDFIQDTGGIRISEPQEKEGKLVLPIEYDASGVIGVTRHPRKINSGLVVRKVQSTQSGDGRIVIRVFTQVEEQTSDPGRIHYADLDDFLPGAYTVYYEDAGDPTKFLGRIRVR
jgi:hypothetical protein